jgi:hypothetical protein
MNARCICTERHRVFNFKWISFLISDSPNSKTIEICENFGKTILLSASLGVRQCEIRGKELAKPMCY